MSIALIGLLVALVLCSRIDTHHPSFDVLRHVLAGAGESMVFCPAHSGSRGTRLESEDAGRLATMLRQALKSHPPPDLVQQAKWGISTAVADCAVGCLHLSTTQGSIELTVYDSAVTPVQGGSSQALHRLRCAGAVQELKRILVLSLTPSARAEEGTGLFADDEKEVIAYLATHRVPHFAMWAHLPRLFWSENDDPDMSAHVPRGICEKLPQSLLELRRALEIFRSGSPALRLAVAKSLYLESPFCPDLRPSWLQEGRRRPGATLGPDSLPDVA